jgi:nucleotide-binding universal stress UspA family protein
VTAAPPTPDSNPIIFSYDGSELAKAAIEEAGAQLIAGRDALVLTVWETFDVGFVPAGGAEFNAAEALEVKAAAEQTAAEGASLAATAGFHVQSRAVRAAPTWKGIVEFADQHDASLIVLGSHGRTGIASRLLGSVAGAVAVHSRRSVLIVHRPS